MTEDSAKLAKLSVSALATIRVHNPASKGAIGFPVCCGVPLAPAAWQDGTPLLLHNGAHVVPCQTTPLTHWHDGSVRWALVECLLDIPAGGELVLKVMHGGGRA